MVRRLAQALVRRRDLAHDVAQDVMLVALRQPHPPEHLRGWLAAVTRRLAGKARRAQHVRARHEGDAAPPPANEAEQHTSERLQLHRRLTDAVLALPEPYRTTVTLRFFDELPPRAIAQRLGVSSEVVRKRLSRGLEMLRERLDGDFGDRAQWVRAFAVVGLLPVGSPWLLLTVLAMNKLALATAAVLAVGVYWFWPRTDVPPAATTGVAAAPAVPAAGDVAAQAALPDAVTERRVAGVTSPAQLGCSLLLVDERGVPIVGASVHCWASGDDRALERTSDREGRCRFGALEGPGGVLVIADGRFPHHEMLAERQGDHRLVMPIGASIDGTLLVDGQPGAGWRMALRSVTLGDSVPKPLRERFSWRGCQAVCGRNGEFAFVGLTAGWRGTLALPQPLWLLSEARDEEDPGALAVGAPQAQLDLRATQLPTIRGRALWSDTKQPVVRPQVMGYAKFVDGQQSPSLSCQGDEDGSFVVGFYGNSRSRSQTWRDPAHRPAFQLVRLTVQDAGFAASAQRELDATALAAPAEVLVYLDRAAITHFRCVDVSDLPIAGARVKARADSEPTDADGRGTFLGRAADVKIVGSPRHRIGPTAPRRSAAGTVDDPLVFVLPRENVVRIRVADRAAGQRCQVRSTVGMFAGRRNADWFDQTLHGLDLNPMSGGTTQADGTTLWNEFTVNLCTDANGEAILHSLEPGVVSEVALLDDFDRSLATASFEAPPFGEDLEVVVPVAARSGKFEGRVLDANGEPLAGVKVRLTTDANATHSARRLTDQRGHFELCEPGDLSGVRLTLWAKGFAEQAHDNLTAGAGPVVYTLQRGREILVSVVDEQGKGVDIAPGCEDSERPDGREWLRTGVWRWRDLPPGKVTFHCLIGADRFEVVHDTSEPVATIRVPRPAMLRLSAANGWPALADARAHLVAVARCLDARHENVHIWGPERGDPRDLLPGTWHIDLFEWSQPDRSLPAIERPLGLSAEITLRAGEHTTAALR